MKINVASLTLRFEICEGWTREKVQELLIDKSVDVMYRDCKYPEFDFDNSYYAVYHNSGHKVFQKDKILQHTFQNPFNDSIDWYYK